MPKETKRRYAINFDLKISNLEKYYSKTNSKGAYKEIARYIFSVNKKSPYGLLFIYKEDRDYHTSTCFFKICLD